MYGTILSGKFIDDKPCVLSFSYKFASNISHSDKTERGTIKNVGWSSCKVPASKHLATFFKIQFSTLVLGPVAQSVKRLATGWTVRGSNPGRGEILRTCQTDPGALLASCTMGTVSFPE
jgi:hypothetical protein